MKLSEVPGTKLYPGMAVYDDQAQAWATITKFERLNDALGEDIVIHLSWQKNAGPDTVLHRYCQYLVFGIN